VDLLTAPVRVGNSQHRTGPGAARAEGDDAPRTGAQRGQPAWSADGRRWRGIVEGDPEDVGHSDEVDILREQRRLEPPRDDGDEAVDHSARRDPHCPAATVDAGGGFEI